MCLCCVEAYFHSHSMRSWQVGKKASNPVSSRFAWLFCKQPEQLLALSDLPVRLQLIYLFSAIKPKLHSLTRFLLLFVFSSTCFSVMRQSSPCTSTSTSSSTMWVQFLLVSSFMGPSKEKPTRCSNCQVRSSIIWPQHYLAQRLPPLRPGPTSWTSISAALPGL